MLIEGWLTKLGESSHILKRRYFKLYDTGKLVYNTKQSGSFKKYADLRVVDSMVFKDDNGFVVEAQKRKLIFYAPTKTERDAWFSLIFQHYFHKGKSQLQLLQKSSHNPNAEQHKKQQKQKHKHKHHRVAQGPPAATRWYACRREHS